MTSAASHIEQVFSGKELALLNYAKKLTLQVGEMNQRDISELRAVGTQDGEIVEVNQVWPISTIPTERSMD